MSTNTTPGQWIRDLLTIIGSGRIGRLYQCPAHPDPTPSLSVRDLDQMAGIKCFAGCNTNDILGSLRLTRRALAHPMLTTPARFAEYARLTVTFPPLVPPARGGRNDPAWRFETAHPYGDKWRLVRWRHPSGAKDLIWESLDTSGAWIPGLRNTTTADLPLYLDREVRMAIGCGEPVHLVESETSADAFTAAGLYATTWAGGASNPPLRRLHTDLTGAQVVLIPDNDPPGIACAERIHNTIREVVHTLAVVMPDDGQDARDLLATNPARIRAAINNLTEQEPA